MAKLTKGQQRTLSGKSPKLKINLKEILGFDVSDSDVLKQALGQAIIDKIQSRSKSGVSRTGSSFRRYSKAYKESLDFKAAGKSGKVNMTLTGDMLELMDILPSGTDGNVITIGWDESDEAAKAHGHITGARSGPKVKRDFFGLPAKELAGITSQFKNELKEVRSAKGDKRAEAIVALANKVSKEFG